MSEREGLVLTVTEMEAELRHHKGAAAGLRERLATAEAQVAEAKYARKLSDERTARLLECVERQREALEAVQTVARSSRRFTKEMRLREIAEILDDALSETSTPQEPRCDSLFPGGHGESRTCVLSKGHSAAHVYSSTPQGDE